MTGRPFIKHQVRSQLLGMEPVDVDHYRLANTRMLKQTGFDLAQLDAQAADLHLMIDTPRVLDHAPCSITRQVAGAVQPPPALLAGIMRVRDEPFGGEARPAMVASRQADAAQVELAVRAMRKRKQIAAENVRLEVVDGRADRDAARARWPAGPVGYVDRSFGRAIKVVKAGVWQSGQGLLRQIGRQRLATADDTSQGIAALDMLAGHERLQHRWHEMQRRHAVSLNGAHQALRVAVVTRLRKRQPGAGQQGPEELPHRDVEAEGGLLQDRISGAQTIGLLHPDKAVDQCLVRVGCTFRSPCRARSVNHVGKVFGVGEVHGIVGAESRQPTVVVIQHNAAHTGRDRQVFEQCTLRQQ